ncbi:unnamed protein product [Brassica napus]|uniref:(rape) hypothetical protein n=1 Tax=Brassica napus TaxID=3708 RepID=A0A816I9B3_BRANA|nr:unnamed protein product [Brassica napus]
MGSKYISYGQLYLIYMAHHLQYVYLFSSQMARLIGYHLSRERQRSTKEVDIIMFSN